MTKHAVVIGAGVGGLSAGLELRRHGFDVTILERHEHVGGKARERRQDAFRWDEGPSIIVMPWVYRTLFESNGLDPDTCLPLLRLDPAFRIVLSDGRIITIPADPAGVEAAFAQIDPRDAAALPRFLRKLDRFASLIGHAYCDRIYERWSDVLLSPLMLSAAVLPPSRTYTAEIDAHFRSTAIRELLYGFPTFSGFDPNTAPASLAIIPWTILREGVWYPRDGGVHAIPLSIARACAHRGVAIQTGVEVEAIERTESGRVRGVSTSSGFVAADVVVSNSDYLHTLKMLRNTHELSERPRRLLDGSSEPSSSFFTLQLACDRTWEHLPHHLVVLTRGSETVYRELYVDRVYPADPPIYVNTTSRTDPRDAPPGGSNPFVVVGAPALQTSEREDTRFAESYADQLIDRLERAGLHGLRAATRTRTITGPADWSRDFHLDRGAIHGLGTRHNVLGGNFRPLNTLPEVPGLYFVGGGVQPGPGLPMVVQSGKLTAARVARDTLASTRRPRHPSRAM